MSEKSVQLLQWDSGNVGFLNRIPKEKHRGKGMHKPAAHTRCPPNASHSCPCPGGERRTPHSATSPAIGMVYVTYITRLQKHTVDINWTDLATVGPSVLPYISGPFPHPLNALHYLLCFI